MALNGPIILIDDDKTDADTITGIIRELGAENDVRHFETAREGVEYLRSTKEKPLVILSDIRMPEQDGLTLVKQIQADEYLRLKAIPFVFFTAMDSTSIIDEAFKCAIQGYYVKPTGYAPLRDSLRVILAYWLTSKHPTTHFADLYKETGKS